MIIAGHYWLSIGYYGYLLRGTMLTGDARTQLRGLGIRTPPDTVISVVQRILNKESIYRISEGDLAVVAKKTATKIKKLLEEGKLSFLYEVQPELEAINGARSVAEPSDDLSRFSAEAASLLGRLGKFSAQYYSGQDLNVELLEALGLSTQESLNILEIRDGFIAKIATVDGTTADLQTLISLLYYVYVLRLHSAREHQPNRDIILSAAQAWAKGWMDGNLVLQKLASDVFIYQIWRGPEFLAAYKRSQSRSRRVERYYLQQFEETLNPGNSEEATNG